MLINLITFNSINLIPFRNHYGPLIFCPKHIQFIITLFFTILNKQRFYKVCQTMQTQQNSLNKKYSLKPQTSVFERESLFHSILKFPKCNISFKWMALLAHKWKKNFYSFTGNSIYLHVLKLSRKGLKWNVALLYFTRAKLIYQTM